jgi:hypothetical protein
MMQDDLNTPDFDSDNGGEAIEEKTQGIKSPSGLRPANPDRQYRPANPDRQ